MFTPLELKHFNQFATIKKGESDVLRNEKGQRLWHRSMMTHQLSMPTSLGGSCRSSMTSLNSLSLPMESLEAGKVGRCLSMIDMKRDTISLCSVSEFEESEAEDGVAKNCF
jgi:hypothetical protein